MPPDLTPEDEQAMQDVIDRGEATPQEEAAWQAYQFRKTQRANPQLITPQTPRVPVPVPPRPLPRQMSTRRPDMGPKPLGPTPMTAPPTGTAVEAPPWYQDMLARIGRQALQSRPSLMGEENITPPELASRGQQRTYTRAMTTNQQQVLREIIEFAPALLAPLLGPAALANPAIQAAVTFAIQDVANRLGNVVDPSQSRNPEAGAALNAGGELLFNVAGRAIPGAINAGRRLLNRTFGETAPWGTLQRETFEDVGMSATPLAVRSERPAPRWIDYAMQHTPFGGRLYDIYQLGEQRLDEAFAAMKRRVGRVGHVTDYVDTLRQGVAGRADEALLETTPQLLRTTFGERLTEVKDGIRKMYSDVDAAYLGEQIPWRLSQQTTPPWRSGPGALPVRVEDMVRHPSLMSQFSDVERSLFGRTAQLFQNLQAMGPYVSLDTARDLMRTVDRFTDEAREHLAQVAAKEVPGSQLTSSMEDLLRTLGGAQARIYETIKPYMVDLRLAKAHAEDLVRPYLETVPGRMAVAEPIQLQGQMGRAGMTQDPLIADAMELTKQPNFVTFTEAHQLRSKLLEVSRLPGPNLGNTTAEQGARMAAMIENAMRETGQQLNPVLLPKFDAAQKQYAEHASVWNSALVMGNMQKNLDDLMTGMIRNERPNDFKMLRVALGKDEFGNDVFDQAAEMWLTRRILGSRSEGLRQVEARPLLKELDGMTDVAMRELFPGGITEVTDALRKMVNMEDAVRVIRSETPDASQLRLLKNTIDDPQAWRAIQSDTIAGWLRQGRDPLDGQHILNQLERLSDVLDIVFTAGQRRELGRFASTLRQVQSITGHRATQWSPVVRKVEHGLLLAAAPVAGAWMTGDVSGAVGLPAAYILGNWGLGRILTNEKVLSYLTQGLRTPLGSIPGARLSGRILGELAAQGLLQPEDVMQVQGQGAPQP